MKIQTCDLQLYIYLLIAVPSNTFKSNAESVSRSRQNQSAATLINDYWLQPQCF